MTAGLSGRGSGSERFFGERERPRNQNAGKLDGRTGNDGATSSSIDFGVSDMQVMEELVSGIDEMAGVQVDCLLST